MHRVTTLQPPLPLLRGLLAELAREARVHRFEVAPNPCVGAALLRGTDVVARGFHEHWGGPHAEVSALFAAEASGVSPSEGDTLVVTLEPCSSTGKTPPCTDLIVKSGVRRVVVGALDPDPRHQGRGVEVLRAAGIEVDVLEGAAPLAETSPHFLKWQSFERLRRPRPWLIAKWAQTRTGQLQPPEDVGEGRWISGPASQSEVQVLRGRVDALVTGVSTVLADDPRLTVRPPGDVTRPPMRVVLDSWLRTPPEARLFQQPGEGEGAGPVHLLCQSGAPPSRAAALQEAGAELQAMPANPADHLALRAVLEWLWDRGARRVLLEAGPTLLGRAFELGFVDQVRIYTGNVNGGRGHSLGEWLSRARLEERLDREVGEDSVLEAFAGATELRRTPQRAPSPR